MDPKGEKILIGIIVTVVAGVGFYAPAFISQEYSPAANTASVASVSSQSVPADAMSPEAAVVSRTIVGTWRSTDDVKFSREFRADGIVVDRYEEETPISTEGIWGAFTADMAPEGTETGLAEGVVYIQTTFDGTSMYFAVAKAADTLELVYLERGNLLSFVRAE